MTLSQAYTALGLSPSASMDEVKAAYRRRALATHPDRGGDAAEFILVQAAYELICAATGETPAAPEIPIPEELREVIRRIVEDFRAQQVRAQLLTDQRLSEFERGMYASIARASRSELRSMGGTFTARWNHAVGELFRTLNRESAVLVQRYDRYVDESTARVFHTLFMQDLRNYRRSGRFWSYTAGFAVLAVLAVMILGGQGGGVSGTVVAVVGLALLVMGPLAFVLHTALRRPRPPQPRTVAVEVFRLDPGSEFRGSVALRQGRRGTFGAGAAGLLVGEAVAGGLAGSVVGAAVGLALGTTVDRVLNPTDRVRESVRLEFAQFMTMARPALVQYVSAGHQEVVAGLQQRLVTDYQAKVKQTVQLLTSGE